MKTIDFQHCYFDFEDWNPMQERCVPFFCQDKNLVISATVAAGKTAIAEAVMSYELTHPGSKAVYVSPLKALGLEKFESWKNHITFGEYKTVILDSDHRKPQGELESAQLIIATVESMNICARRRDKWIENVRVLVFDEAHLFDHEKRGSCSEALMMDVSEINPDCRLICLSGTLSNTAELATWLNALNGKSTSFLNSKWRPTKLIKVVEPIEELRHQMDFIKDKIKRHPKEKILIFVHSKKIGEILQKNLRERNIYCDFYCSNLTLPQKNEILKKFSDEYSDKNVLIATSSLSMGVTL